MARTVKMCDMEVKIALKVFEMLNEGRVKVEYKPTPIEPYKIITDIEPKDLCYPEGWYYAKGCFRNKHTSTNGFYSQVRMVKLSGERWSHSAGYCTLYDD